ncbi:MAG: ParA family protein [Planctomycetota bacterium]
MIYAVINQKGGAGKTTLAVHLAVWLHDRGLKVAFVDNDPQASASGWIAAAEPGITLASLTEADELVNQLPTLNDTHDAVVCDGAPRLNDQTHVLMYLADRIVIPVLPSGLDVRATFQTQQAVGRVAEARAADGLPEPWVRLVMNKQRTVGNQAKLVGRFIKDLGLPLAAGADGKGIGGLGLRDAYSQAVVEDATVGRMAGQSGATKSVKAAAAELDTLFATLTAGTPVVTATHADLPTPRAQPQADPANPTTAAAHAA